VTSQISLPPPVCPRSWFPEYCVICLKKQVFIVGGLGLVACCAVCGDERILTRRRSALRARRRRKAKGKPCQTI
jgi:hypothetical protein